MKSMILLVSAILGFQAQAQTMVPAYRINCVENSMNEEYKKVERVKTSAGKDVLKITDMHLDTAQGSKGYKLVLGGIDKKGNRVLEATEISYDMDIYSERAVLTLTAASGFKNGQLKIYLMAGKKVKNLISAHRVVCQ